MDPKQAFARRLIGVLEEQGHKTTQVYVGTFFGVSEIGATHWLQGEKLPGMKNAIHISTKLGICVEWLLTGRGPKFPWDKPPEDLIDISDLSEPAKASIKTTVSAFKRQQRRTLLRLVLKNHTD